MVGVEGKQPKKEFLMMLIILLRKSEQETGCSLVQYLESFEEDNDLFEGLDVDAYDDKSLRRAIKKYCLSLYPIKDNPNIHVEDLAADDQSAEEVLSTFDDLTPEQKEEARRLENEPAPPPPGFEDDEENLPPIQRLSE